MDIAFFGASLVSAYWNGAATYYRGLLRALHARGHSITFFEPKAHDRQKHRDLAAPDFARSVVYSIDDGKGLCRALCRAAEADLIVKTSGVGVVDDVLNSAVLDLQGPETRVAFWDVAAPTTLDRVQRGAQDALRTLIPAYDMIFTSGGGPPVVQTYEALGARRCVPIYHALDPETHHPSPPDARFEGTLGFLGNRLPDREGRVMEFFFEPAHALPEERFLLGGSGWKKGVPDLSNMAYLGHVSTHDHNAFNSTPRAVLNVSRRSAIRYGFCPPARIFEAAGAGACIITDAWPGLSGFLEPGRECLVAHNGEDVVAHLRALTPERAREIGQAARARLLQEHTYAHRAETVEAALYDVRAADPVEMAS